jgi:hypothetical protein
MHDHHPTLACYIDGDESSNLNSARAGNFLNSGEVTQLFKKGHLP